jgi:hypothetical protein
VRPLYLATLKRAGRFAQAEYEHTTPYYSNVLGDATRSDYLVWPCPLPGPVVSSAALHAAETCPCLLQGRCEPRPGHVPFRLRVSGCRPCRRSPRGLPGLRHSCQSKAGERRYWIRSYSYVCHGISLLNSHFNDVFARLLASNPQTPSITVSWRGRHGRPCSGECVSHQPIEPLAHLFEVLSGPSIGGR